jgi:hypothetical protein
VLPKPANIGERQVGISRGRKRPAE